MDISHYTQVRKWTLAIIQEMDINPLYTGQEMDINNYAQ